jgi:hypothetical protein
MVNSSRTDGTAGRGAMAAGVAGSNPRQGTDQILATRQVRLAAEMPIRLAPQRRIWP